MSISSSPIRAVSGTPGGYIRSWAIIWQSRRAAQHDTVRDWGSQGRRMRTWRPADTPEPCAQASGNPVAADDNHQEDACFIGQIEAHDIPNQHAVSPLDCVVQPGEASVYQRLERDLFFVLHHNPSHMRVRLILDQVPLNEMVRSLSVDYKK